MRELSRCLIACEVTTKAEAADASAGNKFAGAFRVCERLRPHLATYMGSVGFRSLLSRALVLAGAEVAWLRLLQVKVDGSLEGLDKLAVQVSPEEMAEGGVVLVTQVLDLLTAFIGQDLTLQMVRELWSELTPDGFKPDQEDTK